jgi:hypothetical protein
MASPAMHSTSAVACTRFGRSLKNSQASNIAQIGIV